MPTNFYYLSWFFVSGTSAAIRNSPEKPQQSLSTDLKCTKLLHQAKRPEEDQKYLVSAINEALLAMLDLIRF